MIDYVFAQNLLDDMECLINDIIFFYFFVVPGVKQQIWIKIFIYLETFLSLSVHIDISLNFEQEIVS